MVEIIYNYSMNGIYDTEFYEKLDRTVKSLPDEVFYQDDILPKELNSEFNKVIAVELKSEFKDCLINTEVHNIKSLYPYHVEILMAMLRWENNTRYICMFVPYRESVLLWEYNGVSIKYMADEASASIKLGRRWANITDMYVIGYIDPREQIHRGSGQISELN